jgi:uncharacterized SAM-binding protein YcdF (DUF218 family)
MTLGFILKKVIATLLMPLSVTILLMAATLWFVHKGKKKWASGTLIVAIAWLTLLSYGPAAGYLMHRIESTYPPLLEAPQGIEYIYVLGAGHNSDPKLPITSQIGDDAVIRLNEAIRLYHQLDDKPILIVSGFSGYYSLIPHAQMQKRLAIALGVDPQKIVMRPKPVDTQEEAKAAKTLLEKRPFILVTSAYHMARAMRWFRQEGLDPIPAPTRHYTSSSETPYYDLFSIQALKLSTIYIHEKIGTLWQSIKSAL